MKKTFKKALALLLAVLIAFSCMAVCSIAADDEDATEKTYDESKSFWSVFVETIKSWWSFVRYIFYDVFLGRAPGEIPEAPTKQPVVY